jgi:hypothetical protein
VLATYTGQNLEKGRESSRMPDRCGKMGKSSKSDFGKPCGAHACRDTSMMHMFYGKSIF